MAPSRKEVRIALMGATGSGKSAFINLASGGSDMTVGHGMGSCTSQVQESKPFVLDKRNVTLIDTPGFDDTTRSDVDILSCIAAYLVNTYEQDIKLAGIIYMHRISDTRMGGTSTRNFRMFHNLCGDGALRNVVIVTNMWGNVDRKVGEARERELAKNDKFFKPVLKKGARLLRHDGTQASAQAILRRLISNKERTLLIQDEIVNQHKDIIDTAAGAELDRDLREQAQLHKKDLAKLREEMEVAARSKDEETRLELQEELNKEREKLERIKRDSERMAAGFMAEKTRLASKLAQMEPENRRDVVQGFQERASQAVNGTKVETSRIGKNIMRLGRKTVLPNGRKEAERPTKADAERSREPLASGTSRARAPEQERKLAGAERERARWRREPVEPQRPSWQRKGDSVKTHPDEQLRTHRIYATKEREVAPQARSTRISLYDEDSFPFREAGDPPCHGKIGYEDPVFLGSAVFQRSVQPCKILPYRFSRCRVPCGKYEIRHRGPYDLLPFNPRTMMWIPASRGRIPAHRTPVDGGYEESGAKLYHALAFIYGTRVPGRTGEHLEGCDVSYCGVVYTVDHYDILCWK